MKEAIAEICSIVSGPVSAEAVASDVEGMLADIHLYSDGRFADQPSFALANLQLNFHSPETKKRGDSNNVGIVRFDAIRDQRAPSYVYDEFGSRRPNIRQRLLTGQ